MFLWFISGGVLIFKSVFKDDRADLRFLITGLVFLDFLDYILALRFIGKELKLITHSLFFSVLVMFLIMLLSKRGTLIRKNLLLFSIGLYLHLFLDFMWLDQANFLYPLPFENKEIYVQPTSVTIFLELFGFSYLAFKLKTIKLLQKFIKQGII